MANTELEILEEIHKWLEFIGRQEAINVVRGAVEFDDEEKTRAAKRVYQLCNGERTVTDITEQVSFGSSWVSDRQQEWAVKGILKKETPRGQYEHLLSLDELGIDYPEIQGVDG